VPGRSSFAGDLGADGERDRDALGKGARAGHPLHRRPLEVGEIHRGGGHTVQSLRLGHDLLADLKRRDLVEHVGDREHGGSDVRQLPGRAQVLGVV
jgi:hypothetical protein